MQHRTIAALADRLRTCIPLSKSRLETLCLLIIGAIGARTVNLGHIATERGGPVQPASTYRRLQRFFQFFGLAPDWAAPLLAATLGTGRWTLVLDRTNWKIGRTEVNYLVLRRGHPPQARAARLDASAPRRRQFDFRPQSR
jgi:hypothetical protein